MRDIDDFFCTKPTEPLYHYTSIGAVVGISSSTSLWASNAYYLNDSSEVLEAIELTAQVAESVAADSAQPVRELLKQLVGWLASLKSPQGLYVFSLSRKKNDLSQWRAYTPYGKGVALTFFPERIEHIAQTNDCKIVRCLYGRKEKEGAARRVVEKTIETWKAGYGQELGDAHPSQSHHPAFESLKSHYLSIFAAFKNQSFKEEEEWRLIAYAERFADDRVGYREGASLLVPYFKIGLAGFHDYLVDEVWVGPTEHQNLSMDAMGRFMSTKKFAQRSINACIPYREFR